MKSIALILSYLSSPVPRRNLRVVLGLLATLVLVALSSVVFTCPVRDGSAQVEPRPNPTAPVPADASLGVVGDAAAQERVHARAAE